MLFNPDDLFFGAKEIIVTEEAKDVVPEFIPEPDGSKELTELEILALELTDVRANRSIDNIPLNDPYWEVQARLHKAHSNSK